MSQTDKRLEQLGIELPKKNRRGQGVVAVRQCGDMLFVSGHGPTDQTDPADTPIYTGKLGADLTVEQGYQAARLCGINLLGRCAGILRRFGQGGMHCKGIRSCGEQSGFF